MGDAPRATRPRAGRNAGLPSGDPSLCSPWPSQQAPGQGALGSHDGHGRLGHVCPTWAPTGNRMAVATIKAISFTAEKETWGEVPTRMGKPGVQPAPKATNTSPGPDQAWDPGPLEGREAPSFKWHRLGPALKAGNRPGDSPSLTDQGRAFWGDPRSAQRQSGDKGTRGKQSHQGLEGDEGGWALSAGGRQGPGPRQTQAEAGAASPAAGTGAGSALCWGSGEAVATVRPRTRVWERSTASRLSFAPRPVQAQKGRPGRRAWRQGGGQAEAAVLGTQNEERRSGRGRGAARSSPLPILAAPRHLLTCSTYPD